MSEESLTQKVNNAHLIRELLTHPGMVVMRAKIDKATARDHSKWLLAENDETASRIRTETRGYELFFTLAKQVMIEGDNAAHILNPPSDKEQGA